MTGNRTSANATNPPPKSVACATRASATTAPGRGSPTNSRDRCGAAGVGDLLEPHAQLLTERSFISEELSGPAPLAGPAAHIGGELHTYTFAAAWTSGKSITPNPSPCNGLQRPGQDVEGIQDLVAINGDPLPSAAVAIVVDGPITHRQRSRTSTT